MNSTKKTARVAGFLYLFMVVTGIFNFIYAPSKLLVRGNATATAANILASQSLFNINIVDGLVAVVSFLFVALVLYRLLKEVNKQHAALMVILVLVQIPLGLSSPLLGYLADHQWLRLRNHQLYGHAVAATLGNCQ